METPHFEVIRVREGEEFDLLSYLLPKKLDALKEAEGREVPEVDAKPKKFEEPVLKGFASPAQSAPTPPKPTPKAVENKPAVAEESKPGLVSRFFKALSNFLFSSSAEEEKVEEKPAKPERREGQRNNRNRRNRNDNRRRNSRDNRNENRNDNRDDKREDKRDNKRKSQQRDETANDNKQQANERKQQNRKPKERRNNKRDEAKANTKVAEEGLKLASDAQQGEKPNRSEEKAAKVKERRQRRKLSKQVRVKDQAAKAKADEEAKLVKSEAIAETVEEKAVEAATEETAEQPKQRRNRRSPRHLRASGQRRRRGRDRRPNPFRLRKGGVASPEMAMGKVMPSYGITKPAPKQQAKTDNVKAAAVEANVETNVASLGGFACPEMAMGKVIVRREQPVVEAKAEVTAPITPEVKPEPVVEAPAVVEAPVVVETIAEEAPKVEEAKAAPSDIVVPQSFKGHASAAMAKAPGNTEMKEITVNAAPFKAERYESRGAGSQVASNQAGATMTKPQF
jgi:ribonuclease E